MMLRMREQIELVAAEGEYRLGVRYANGPKVAVQCRVIVESVARALWIIAAHPGTRSPSRLANRAVLLHSGVLRVQYAVKLRICEDARVPMHEVGQLAGGNLRLRGEGLERALALDAVGNPRGLRCFEKQLPVPLRDLARAVAVALHRVPIIVIAGSVVGDESNMSAARRLSSYTIRRRSSSTRNRARNRDDCEFSALLRPIVRCSRASRAPRLCERARAPREQL